MPAVQGLQTILSDGTTLWYTLPIGSAIAPAMVGHDLLDAVQRGLTYLLIAVFGVLTVGALVHLHPHAGTASGAGGGRSADGGGSTCAQPVCLAGSGSRHDGRAACLDRVGRVRRREPGSRRQRPPGRPSTSGCAPCTAGSTRPNRTIAGCGPIPKRVSRRQAPAPAGGPGR
ncbi:hypothetical protein [Kitasatospora griseola]|uniref:hypothetical protein n=1 Tax=Kitasatospora griseola TaxID=2064 RepID=UPI00364F21BE